MIIFGEWLWQNLTKMPITLDTVAQIQQKLHFWTALIKTFRLIFIYDIIPCHMVSKFAYFVELRIDYQLAKFQRCRLSVPSFIDGLRKTQ